MSDNDLATSVHITAKTKYKTSVMCFSSKLLTITANVQSTTHQRPMSWSKSLFSGKYCKRQALSFQFDEAVFFHGNWKTSKAKIQDGQYLAIHLLDMVFSLCESSCQSLY